MVTSIYEFFYLGFALGVTCNSRPSTAARWASRGQGCWSWVRSREHEILSQGLTGLASARHVLPEEVSGPHAFERINLIYFLPLHNYTLITVHN
jgi:hypothetical protein